MKTWAQSVIVAALLASPVVGETVWSSVAYILYGDRTPLRGNADPALTPLGARQLWSQGSVFRARYLEDSSADNDTVSVTSFEPIASLEKNAIDNTQLSILSTDDQYVLSSALAFMQGLYPPKNQSFADGAGGLGAAKLADRTLIDFPLNGYQYPKVQSLSAYDQNFAWIQGNAGCVGYDASLKNEASEPATKANYEQSLDFYQTLWNSFFKAGFPKEMANYDNAYVLYDYARFYSNHDSRIESTLNSSTMERLQDLAFQQQQERNGDLGISGGSKGDMIRAVAGRMLAGKVVSQLKDFVASGGMSSKLNLMFGSFEAFIAFFALAELGDKDSSSQEQFKALPGPGAAIVFELFSSGDDTTTLPAVDDLKVRFMYRPSTDSNDSVTSYSLFGNGKMESAMQYNDFVHAMEGVAISSVADWCGLCGTTGSFCASNKSETDSYKYPLGTSGYLGPVVSGVIGAAVTVAVVGLAALGTIFIGGVRFHRVAKSSHSSSISGFKSPEKNASDVDVVVSRGGIRHERTGSWELRSGRDDTAVTGPGLERDAGSFDNRHADEDGISEMHIAPTKPRETV